MYYKHFDCDVPFLWTVEGPLSPQECAAQIARGVAGVAGRHRERAPG
jgi:hypothetical protein